MYNGSDDNYSFWPKVRPMTKVEKAKMRLRQIIGWSDEDNHFTREHAKTLLEHVERLEYEARDANYEGRGEDR